MRLRVPRLQDPPPRALAIAIVCSILLHLLLLAPVFLGFPIFGSPMYIKKGEALFVDMRPERPDEKAPLGNPSRPVGPDAKEAEPPKAVVPPAPKLAEAPKPPAPKAPPRAQVAKAEPRPAPPAARAAEARDHPGAQPGEPAVGRVSALESAGGLGPAAQSPPPAGRRRRASGRRPRGRRRRAHPARHARAEVPGLLQQDPREDQGELDLSL